MSYPRITRSNFGSYRGTLKAELFLWCCALPLTAISEELRIQVRMRRKYFPDLPAKYRVIRYRNWGTELSLTLTGFFKLPVEDLHFTPNAEVLAHFGGEEEIRDFYTEARESMGWSQGEVSERRRRVEKLLSSDSSTFFSEVSLSDDGRYRVTDGHHRATIALAQGKSQLSLIHTVKVRRF